MERDLEPSPDSSHGVAVLLGEFGPAMRRGLLEILGEDPRIELVAPEPGARRLEQTVAHARPDVVVVDGASTAVRALRRRLDLVHPEVRIVVLADRPSRSHALALLGDGAAACVCREAPAADILAAVGLAVEGKHLIACAGTGRQPTDVDGSEILTRRERDVLAHLQSDAMNAEIASLLNIGVETVRTHAANIYRKLGVAGRHDLRAIARPGSE